MGLLHKLWDETLAGPAPDFGLEKLSKFNTFSDPPSAPSMVNATDEAPVVTRSIRILRTRSSNIGKLSADNGAPNFKSPSTPVSHAAKTPRRNFRNFTRRKSSSDPLQRAERCTSNNHNIGWRLRSYCTKLLMRSEKREVRKIEEEMIEEVDCMGFASNYPPTSIPHYCTKRAFICRNNRCTYKSLHCI